MAYMRWYYNLQGLIERKRTVLIEEEGTATTNLNKIATIKSSQLKL